MSTLTRSTTTRVKNASQLGASPFSRYRFDLATWTTRSFVAGGLVIAAHLIDDAVLEAAPGAQLSDHLVSGGVTTAIVLAAILVWPFVGSAWRAIMALTLGSLAVGTGVLTHGERLADGDLTRNHLSGAFMTLGGVLLVGLGVVLSHRSIAKPVQRNLRWVGRRALALVALYLAVVYLVIPVLTAVYATHPRQADVRTVDLGMPYEEITFTTADGLTLAGWFTASQNGATIILVPGGNNDRTRVAEHAALLVRHGYGVLLFDPRGMGASEGDPNQFGWQTPVDIRAALAYLATRPDVDPTRIGAFGSSMGGEAVLQAAAEYPQIQAVAAEGAGARILDEVLLEPGVKKWLGLPATWLGYVLTDAFSGADPPPSLQDLVPRIAPRPLLLIYATQSDQAGESYLSPLYYDAAGEPKELWAVPEGGHTDGLAVRREEYESRLIQFYDAALLSTHTAP